MKKFYLLFFIIFLNLATASPILVFQHDEIQSGETILATITSPEKFIKQIEPGDITFLERRKQVFFEYDITFYDDTHYLYIYTTREGNFTIKIENILFKEEDILKSTTIERNFTIQDLTNQTQILSIKPGFVFTTQSPLIKLINKGISTINITYDKNIISIEPTKTKQITPLPTTIFSTAEILTYKKFSIPIIYPPANGTLQAKQQLDLKQDPELLLIETFVKTKSEETIKLFNFGDTTITDIVITSDIPFIKTESIKEIPARGIHNLTIKLSPTNPGHFQGKVNVTYAQYGRQNTLQIPLSIFVLPKGSDPENFQVLEETCEEKQGIVCTAKEICNGKASFTKNNEYCCIGTCEPIEQNKKGFSYGWLIAILILIILAGGGYYLYKKQKKVIPQKPEEKIQETSEKYTKRIKGGLTKN